MGVHQVDLEHIIEVLEAVDGLQLDERDARGAERERERDQVGDVPVSGERVLVMIREINLETASPGEKFVCSRTTSLLSHIRVATSSMSSAVTIGVATG